MCYTALYSAVASKIIAELDGIRGIAILLVLMIHLALMPGLPAPLFAIAGSGWAGVDLFFVLSGFLITGILLKSKGESGYFRTFYWHRTLRIFPLYYAFLLITLPFAFEVQQIAYWLYLGNFLNATGSAIPFMNHFWSLAIEEQFYWIWPLVVWRLPVQQLARLCAALITLVVIARFATVHFTLRSPEYVFTFTPLRSDPLLMGGLIACLYELGWLQRFGWAVKGVALAGAVSFAFGIMRAHGTGYIEPAIERYGYLGADLLCASGIGACVIWQGAGCLAPLRSGVLRFFGKYSYAIYVFHYPLSRVILPWSAKTMSPLLAAVASFVIGTAVSTALALVSWNVLEKRFLALKRRLPAGLRAAAGSTAESSR